MYLLCHLKTMLLIDKVPISKWENSHFKSTLVKESDKTNMIK